MTNEDLANKVRTFLRRAWDGRVDDMGVRLEFEDVCALLYHHADFDFAKGWFHECMEQLRIVRSDLAKEIEAMSA